MEGRGQWRRARGGDSGGEGAVEERGEGVVEGSGGEGAVEERRGEGGENGRRRKGGGGGRELNNSVCNTQNTVIRVK